MSTSQDNPRKSDAEKALEDVRREVIESRNLVIKTDNLLKSLHAELKAVGKRQEDFERKAMVSSAVAYVLFVVLGGAAAFFWANARGATEAAERKRAEARLTEVQGELDKVRTNQAASAKSQAQALEIHRQLMQSRGEQRLKAVEAYRALDASKLSELERWALSERATAITQELGQSSFEKGKAAFRRNEYAVAVAELERFLSLNPVESEAIDARFFLGASYLQVRKPQKAIEPLSRFINEDKKAKTRDYAMLLLSQAYEQTQQFEQAIEIAREAVNTYPNSTFLPALKARLSAGKRGGDAGPVSPAPTGAADAGRPAPSTADAGAQPQ